MKLAIRNTDAHLIKGPRYVGDLLGTLRGQDNRGNAYSLRHPGLSDVGGNWIDVSLPIPEEQKGRQTYKPGEASWDVKILHLNELVNDVGELQIYLVKGSLIHPES